MSRPASRRQQFAGIFGVVRLTAHVAGDAIGVSVDRIEIVSDQQADGQGGLKALPAPTVSATSTASRAGSYNVRAGRGRAVGPSSGQSGAVGIAGRACRGFLAPSRQSTRAERRRAIPRR